MTWKPHWFDQAQTVALGHGWKVIEQSDGRLAFQSATAQSPIIFTGNEPDAPAAISRAAALMTSGAAIPTGDPISGLDAALKDKTAQLALQANLEHKTNQIAAAVPIVKAIVDGKKAMSFAEKMATLAARSQAVPKALEARADALLPRLDALEAKGKPVFDGLESVIADAEKGVAVAESAMRQLSNGPLSGSGD